MPSEHNKLLPAFVPLENVEKWMKTNYPDRHDISPQVIMDILTVSRIYDRNFERIQRARADNDAPTNIQRLQKIEGYLDVAGALLRESVGIRPVTLTIRDLKNGVEHENSN